MPEEGENSHPQGNAKRAALFCLKLIVSGSLMYFVLSKAGTAKVTGMLAKIDFLLFAGAVGVFFMMMALCSLRWGLLLPEHFSQRRLLPLYMIGSFFNVFLPGLVGGDVVKVYYLYRETKRGAQALASVFMDRYMGYAGLMTLGALAYPFGYKSFAGTWIAPLLPGIVAFFIIASLVLFLTRPGGRFAFIARLHDYFKGYWQNKSLLFKALGISVCVHTLSSTCVWLIASGLGENIPLLTLFVFVPVIATLAALPISVAGLGIREAAFVVLFGTMGISPEKATAISFAWFLAMAVGGLPGIVFYLREKSGKTQKSEGQQVH